MAPSAHERMQCLDAALEMLDLQDEGHRPAVIAELQELADIFISERDSPRVSVKHLAADLDRIEQLSSELAKLLDQYEERMIDALGSRWQEWDAAPVHRLSLDTEQLRAASQAAGTARGAIVDQYGSGDPDIPDKGGPPLSVRLDGTPKRRFVEGITSVWARYRPDALTEKAEGPLQVFVETCWEWATGDPKPKGIQDDLRRVVPQFRKARDREVARQWRVAAAMLRRLGLFSVAEECERKAEEGFD